MIQGYKSLVSSIPGNVRVPNVRNKQNTGLSKSHVLTTDCGEGKEIETEDLAHDGKKQRIVIWCFAAFRKSSNHQGTLLLVTSPC